MAHIPLIHGPDGAKLSKRHGALGIEAYRAMGYLPVALRNYLVRLGWSHGDEEIISTEDMIRWFDVDEINKGAARFDFAKLEALNGHWIRRTDDAALVEMLMSEREILPNGAILTSRPDAETRAKLLAAMPGLKERAKTLVELTESTAYLFASRPLPLEEKAAATLDDDGRKIVGAIMRKFEAAEWTAQELETIVRDYAEAEGLKLGKVAQPLRAALTGRTTSPGVFDVLEVLGREESLARLSDQAR
jgi:glutamyl-tRNA synthetase